MADGAEVRDAILAWAAQHGILAYAAQAAAGAETGKPDILPFDGTHVEFFRTRNIVRVQLEHKGQWDVVTVSSRRRIAATKIKELTARFDEAFKADHVRLAVTISQPFKVDHAVQAYGRFDPIRKWHGRLACGSSIGIGNQRNAGTLTALATRTDGRDDRVFGLSCNHVIGGCSTTRPGTPIVMPGIQDVGPERSRITVVGRHHAAAPMSQGLPSVIQIEHNMDLACFEVTAPSRVSSVQGSGEGGFDTPDDFVDQVTTGLVVKKWGRSTGLTRGRVANIVVGGEPVDYNITSHFGPMDSQVFRGTVFFDQVFEIDPIGGPFSLGGDSGALVVTDIHDAEAIVGIVIAGSREKSLALPLRPMLDALHLTILSGHNT
jgi:hypothetical protein